MFAFLGPRIDGAAVLATYLRGTTPGTLQSRLRFLGLDEGLWQDHS